MNRGGFPVRLAVWVMLVFLVITGVTAPGPVAAAGKLASELNLSSADTVLVIAPHPDDETLAAGGLIQEAVSLGADVFIVFMTSGDGFRAAINRRHLFGSVSPKDFRKLGLKREKEASRAVRALGVPEGNSFFLGYPDRGLMTLWTRCWSSEQPFRSPFSGLCRVSYPHAFDPQAPYTAPSVVKDLEDIMRLVRPTIVIFPDASDSHPDHVATHAFVVFATGEFQSDGQGKGELRLYAYTIHGPSDLYSANVDPQFHILSWSALAVPVEALVAMRLDKDRQLVKRKAVSLYESQVRIRGKFLYGFVRDQEDFIDYFHAEAHKLENLKELKAAPSGGA